MLPNDWLLLTWLPGHAVEPVGDRLPRHVRRLADEDEERGLKRIFRVMVVVEEATANAPHHRGVPPHLAYFVASTSLSSQRADLIHQFDDGRGVVPTSARLAFRSPARRVCRG
jgi:hypothetical protein